MALRIVFSAIRMWIDKFLAHPAEVRSRLLRLHTICNSRMRLLLLGVVFASSTHFAWAQAKPYGIAEREPNLSLLIDLESGLPPATISASGLFSDVAAQTPASGLIPYAVNSQLWSDGAYKTRYLALPGEAQIEFSPAGFWRFPAHSVLVKNFYLQFVKGDPASREIVETRFLVKVGNTEQWRGFSYQWNEDASDAILLADRATQTFFIEDSEAEDGFLEYNYTFPGPEDCNLCHTEVAGRVLGLQTAQLNGLYDYGGTLDNQLRTLNHLGVFSEDIGEDYGEFPRWENPLDEMVPIEIRARSYLAANCSHCHRPGGIERAAIDLRFTTPLIATNTVGWPPMLGRLDAADARIISPGDADNSTILLRTLSFTSNRMPPVATSLIDAEGTAVLRRWIEDLAVATAVAAEDDLPATFALAQNFPNPFNPATSIAYRVSVAGPVELVVYDALGQRVRALVAAEQVPGRYTSQWDGRDDSGRVVTSGVYFYQLRAGAYRQTRKLMLLK